MTNNATPVGTPLPGPIARPEEVLGPFGKIRRDLAFLDRIPPEDAKHLCAMVARLPIARNIAEAAAFVDHLWFFARNAEFRTGSGRLTGAEMDTYRERLDKAVYEVLLVTNELARRVGLTEILQRHGRLLARNGIDLTPPQFLKPKRGPVKPEIVHGTT